MEFKIYSIGLLYHLEPILQMFWIIAIPSSIIFLIHIISILTGINNIIEEFNNDIIRRYESNKNIFQIFNFKNLINFLTSFSWCGIAFYSYFTNKLLLITISILFGIGFMFIFCIILKEMNKWNKNDNFDISKTIGMIGEVYLKIPKKYLGKGKILLSYNGSIKELDAITQEQNDIPQQTQVKIIFINHLKQVEVIKYNF